VDVALPFTVLQLFPSGAGRSERRVVEEQQNLYLWAEGLLDRWGLPGRSCVLHAVCELAAAGGLAGQGLAARALQALLLMEYTGEGGEEGLVEYLAARAEGRGAGRCGALHPCPASLASLDGLAKLAGQVDPRQLASLLSAIPSGLAAATP
jgi:hypothetical protein